MPYTFERPQNSIAQPSAGMPTYSMTLLLSWASGQAGTGIVRTTSSQDYLFSSSCPRLIASRPTRAPLVRICGTQSRAFGDCVDLEPGLHHSSIARNGGHQRAGNLPNPNRQALRHPWPTLAIVRDTGNSGDLLDLHVALAPCLVGYA